MKMSGVIYADVLVVVNVYITYLLLRSTALLIRAQPDKIRLFTASLLGGIYALTVLLPEELSSVLVFLRVIAAGLFIFIAFGFKSVKMFLKLNVYFFLCSFIFAGLMFALWYFVCPAGMYFNGSVVYFDIDVLTLVVLTVICYGFLRLFELIFRTRTPVNTLYFLTVTVKGYDFELKAFLDTGNQLSDPFNGYPVIIADNRCFEKLFGGKNASEYFSEYRMHYIFCSTLGGKGMLEAFCPEKVHIKGVGCDFNTRGVMVALTDKRLMQGEYDAILPSGIFSDNYEGKDEEKNEKVEACN